jgi:metallo-beta-lactamase class B
MTNKETYEEYVKRQYLEPKRIFGNLYFIGIRAVCTHLIDTGAGLIVIDPGYYESLEIIKGNIEKLGFKLSDLKYIVVTHAHYDHMDSVAELVKLTGAKTFMGKRDIPLLNGEIYQYPIRPFKLDVPLSDGDVISLGNTEILCLETPGHTDGTMSFFFNVTDGEKTYRAGTFGGAGHNTLCREFLDEHNRSYSSRDDYFNSIKKIRGEVVEIFLGNHLGNNRTEEKLSLLETSEVNPFIENSQAEWEAFLDKRYADLEALIEKE